MIIHNPNKMRAMKKIIITGVFGMVMAGAAAQQLPFFNQYYINPFIYNPSLAGTGEDAKAFLMHKSQWTDMPGAPVTSLLSVDGPIREKNVGIGLSVFNDVSNITERFGAYSSYSYKISIDSDNRIYAGVAVGVLSTKIDFSKALVKDANDPFLQRNIERKATFDANVGVTYMWKVLEVGVAVPQIVGQKVSFVDPNSTTYYQLNRHFLASAKYTFDVVKDKGMTAYSLVMVRAAKGAPIQYDINGVFDWANRGWVGVSYRSNYAVGLNLGVRLNNTLSAGYAYDLNITSMSTYTGGAHEIMLSYAFGRKSDAPVVTAPAEDVPLSKTTENVNDSVIAALKKNDKLQKAQIDRLEAEVEKLRVQSISSALPSDTAKGDVRAAKSTDYKDESGSKLDEGSYYVIIGSFQQPENATSAKKEWLGYGYIESQTILNNNNGYTYVTVLKTRDEAKARQILSEVRQKVADSWIFFAK